MEPTDTQAVPVPPTPPAPRKRAKRNKTPTPRAPRVPRQPHELRVGIWSTEPNASGAPVQAFRLLEPNVPPGMTEVVDLVAWAKKTLGAGEYDVIRVLPGKLRVAKQETFKAGFEETK